MASYNRCRVCDKTFKVIDQKRKYCSAACKQKAYRIARGQDTSWDAIRERARRGAQTKAGMSVKKICIGCGMDFYAHGNNYGMMEYCSNACKQRAYRKRKAQQ